MSIPYLAEDSNLINLAPNLSEAIKLLDEDADKYDLIMTFFITIMSESGYRVSCLYETTGVWSKQMICIPQNWKTTCSPNKNIYEINFLSYNRRGIGCKLFGIPCGDWLVLNLLPKGASSRCRTRSLTINVVKHVNMYQTELNKFWHLKELALKFKNNLLAPMHGEIMMEIGMAGPSLEGLPEEVKALIIRMLDQNSRENLKTVSRYFRIPAL